jgi:hypothetical protein
MKLVMSLIGLFVVSSLSASELRLVKVTEIGPMKNKVIFQSSDVSKIKNSNMVRGKLIAQWGTEVFEVITGYYQCNKRNVCKLNDYERVATFESCKIKNKKATCSKKITGDDSINNSQDVITEENPDSREDGFNRENDNDSEFPVRIQDEFSDIF